MTVQTKPSAIGGKKLKMVRFPREGFIDGPFLMFMMDQDLRKSFLGIGPHSFFVLESSIPLLKSKGLTFQVVDSTKESELTAKQLADIEKGKASWIKFKEAIFFWDHSW